MSWINKHKKILIALLMAVTLVFGLMSYTLAADTFGVNNVGQTVNLAGGDLRVTIANIIRVFLGFLGIVFLCVILYGGFMYMTAGGTDQKIDTAKKILINGTIGLVIIMASFAITSFVIGALSDATGIGANINGSCPPGSNCGGGNVPTGSGFTLRVSPEGPNKPLNSRITITYPANHAPLPDNDYADAKTNIKVFTVVNAVETELTGTVTVDANVVTFTPTGTCPAVCKTTGCFAEQTSYKVKVNSVKDINGDSSACPNASQGYCYQSVFGTSSSCDVDAPVATIGVTPNPVKLGTSITGAVTVTDDGGIDEVKFCPGVGGTCQDVFPAGNPLTFSQSFSGNTAGMPLGNTTATVTTTDITGKISSSTKDYLIASSKCFAPTTTSGVDVFNCKLPGCEVPCSGCEKPGACECTETCTLDCYKGNIDSAGKPCDPATGKVICNFNDVTHYWNFDSLEGNKVKDLIGGVDGTVVNATLVDDAKWGKAIKFNGKDTPIDYVDFGNNLDVGSDNFTIMLWAKSFGYKQSATLLSKGANFYSNGPGYFFAYASSPKYLFGGIYDYPVGTNVTLRSSSLGLGVNATTGVDNWADTWAHLAIVRDGTTVRVYKDGVKTATTLNVVTSLSNSLPLVLGASSNKAKDFDGVVDEMVFYNRALSDAEIAGIKSCDPTATATDCKARTPDTCADQYKSQVCFPVCESYPWPIIESVSPTTGPKSSFVSLYGQNFGAFVAGTSKVLINGVEAGMACGRDSWSGNQVIVKIPDTATTGAVKLVAGDGHYNDTSNATQPGWKGNITVQAASSDWVGLCSVKNIVAAKDNSGEPGDEAYATGQNFATTAKVFFGGQEATSARQSDTRIENIKVPNIALGNGPVQVGQGTPLTYSNIVYFDVLAKQNKLTIDAVVPTAGPKSQIVTIKGKNFGDSGTVYFVKGTDRFLADPACGVNWTNDQIIIKVPEAITSVGAFGIQVTGADGTDTKNFTVNTDPVAPGICRLSPDNGPAGTKIKIMGSGFGDAAAAGIETTKLIKYKDHNGTVGTLGSGQMNLDKVQWNDTTIEGVMLPAGAISGDLVVEKAGLSSNPVLFKVGTCTATSCTGGQVCCNNTSCVAADACQRRYTNSEYGWYFSTGEIPEIPQILERECVLQSYDESVSPSNGEINACPNGLISFTFNMQMDLSTFALQNVEVRKCKEAGKQCNLEEGDTSDFDTIEVNLTKVLDQTKTPPSDRRYTTSTFNGHEVTQVILYDTPLVKDYWYRVIVPKDLGVTNAKGTILTLASDYSWIFHTSDTDCTISNVLVSPEEGVIEDIAEIEKYQVRLQSNNCAIMDASPYVWNWTKVEHVTPEKLEIKGGQGTIEATYGIKSAAIDPETGDKPADIKATAAINGKNFEDSARLAVKFLAPTVLEYWPACDAACRNAELGALFSTTMRKSDLLNNNTNVKLYKCTDKDCLSVVGVTNKVSASEITCDMKSGSGTNCNRVKINLAGNNVLDPSAYYRVVLMNSIVSTSNKSLTGLNFNTAGIVSGVCGNGLIETGEDCEAVCLNKKTGAACTFGQTDCECNLANNKVCNEKCKFSGFTACATGKYTACCGNGVIDGSEKCEASCLTIGKKEYVGSTALTACTAYLNTLGLDRRVSTACSCAVPATCADTQKTCQKYCKGDIKRTCTNDSTDCTCIEASFCLEDQSKVCDGNNVAPCTCKPDLAVKNGDGSVGAHCAPSATGCFEYGHYQFSPNLECFVDAVDSPTTPSVDESKTLGKCIKKNHCTQDETKECTADIAACTCKKLSEIPSKACPDNLKVCQNVCSLQEKVTCTAGSANCQCTMPDTCSQCVLKSSLEAASQSVFNSFSWVFKVKEGDAYCKPEKIQVDPVSYISLLAGEDLTYSASPLTAPDECAAGGQKLNAYNYKWNWTSNPTAKATLLDDDINTATPAVADPANYSAHRTLISIFNTTYGAARSLSICSDNCLNQGSVEWASVCGNGKLEAGEECDGSVGCSDNCLRRGTGKCFGSDVSSATSVCCGNGRVDVGEECDGGPGCSADTCLRSGSSSTGVVCGNGKVEAGEDEDFGDKNSKYGLNNQCLFIGSTYPKIDDDNDPSTVTVKNTKAICGDGTLEITKGEECEPAYVNCLKPSHSGATVSFVACSPTENWCVCDYSQDTYCGTDCKIRGFKSCNSQSGKVCHGTTTACTFDYDYWHCVPIAGQATGYYDKDGNGSRSSNETETCVVDRPACVCEATTATSCCGNGVKDSVTYTINGQTKTIAEECDAVNNCFKVAGTTTATCDLSTAKAYYDFNAGTGTTVATANGAAAYNGTITGTQWAPGYKGQGLEFKSTADAVKFGDVFDLKDGSSTFSVWVKPTVKSDVRKIIFSKGATSGVGRYRLYVENPDGKTTFVLWLNAGGSLSLVSNRNINDDQWHNVTLSANRNGKISLYVDGVLAQETNFNYVDNFDSPANFYLGASSSSETVESLNQPFLGLMDDFTYYDRALTATEVANMYDGCKVAGTVTKIPCTYGSTGCVCTMPSYCSATCLNTGSTAVCGNGAVENGEDASCEDTTKTVAGGTRFGAPYSFIKVLGYLPTAAVQDSTKVMATIGQIATTAPTSAISGAGDFTYKYVGTGPIPTGCDLNNPPAVDLISPAATNACPNGVITMKIDSRVTAIETSANKGQYVEVRYQAETCPGVTMNQNWFRRLTGRVASTFRKATGWIFGQPAMALQACLEPASSYTVTAYPTDNNTKTEIKIEHTGGEPMKATSYIVSLKNLPNNCSQVMPEQRVTFSVGPKMCHLDSVAINPSDLLLTERGVSKTIRAMAMSGTTEIAPTSNYTWTWQNAAGQKWVMVDTTLATVTLGTPPPTNTIDQIAPLSKNGRTTLTATAKIGVDKYFGQTGTYVAGSAPLEVFLCENPWNPDPTSSPVDPDIGWSDNSPAGKNIRLLYCLDAGKINDTTDDLPDLRAVSAPTDLLGLGAAQCNDGIDNDGDGNIDFTFNNTQTLSMDFDVCRVYNKDNDPHADLNIIVGGPIVNYTLAGKTYKVSSYMINSPETYVLNFACDPGVTGPLCDQKINIGSAKVGDKTEYVVGGIVVAGKNLYYMAKSYNASSQELNVDFAASSHPECDFNPPSTTTIKTTGSVTVNGQVLPIEINHPILHSNKSTWIFNTSLNGHQMSTSYVPGTPGSWSTDVDSEYYLQIAVTNHTVNTGVSPNRLNMTVWVRNGKVDPDCGSVSDSEYPDTAATNCADGVDNDFDNMIDSNDPDCAKYGLESQSTMLNQYYFLRGGAAGHDDRSTDAIALRVYSNPENLSPRDWYKQQFRNSMGIQTEPKDLGLRCNADPVTGKDICYYGVQDGNTVYISGGNLDINTTNPSQSKLYNNIYVLAYNLGANSATVNIVTQMLNTISLNTNVNNSDTRWAILRDIKRINDITGLRGAIVKYFAANNTVPALLGGTYSRGMTVSSWPSWQAELGQVLSKDLAIDPINTFEKYLPCDTSTPECKSDPVGIACGENMRCRNSHDQCFAADGNQTCSICAPGSDPVTCYNSTTLNMGLSSLSEYLTSASYIYGYQFKKFNSAQLFFSFEGVKKGLYQINNSPSENIDIIQ
jgi:hypothetical protein